MDDQKQVSKLSATSLLLLWSGWFLSQIAQSLLADIPNPFYEQVGALLGYKRLLNICLFLLIATASLLILYFSKHVNRKESSSDNATNPTISDEQRKINALQNLTPLEQQKLKDFVKAKTLIVKDSDITALAFLKDKIIEDLGTDAHSRKIYKIDNFVLSHLKTHPDLLGQTLPDEASKEMELQKERVRLLTHLSDHEKQYLQQYFDVGKKSLEFNIYDSAFQDLIRNGILFKPADMEYAKGITFVIQEWAWECLKEHPDLLERELPQKEKLQVEYLTKLSPDEKQLLRDPLLDQQIDAITDPTKKNRIVIAHKTDVTALSLRRANILIFLSEYGNNQIQYKVDDFVVAYLAEHIKLLL